MKPTPQRRSKITAGQFKGLPLSIPAGIRATEAKVRLALFNILGDAIVGARVVDGFAGSGSLGIEALSRGAGYVAFVESDTDSVMSIRDNLARLESELPEHSWRLLHRDIESGLQELASSEPVFDFIFLDPPYRTDDGKKALNALTQCAMLAPSGFIVIEHDQRTVLPSSTGPLRQGKQHRYGDTVLSFYQHD